MPFKVNLKVSPPPMGKRIANFSKAMVDVAKATAKGAPLFVSHDEKERRMMICQECDAYYDFDKMVCNHQKCGCFMKIKPWLHAASCPVSKWISLTPAPRNGN